MSRVAHALTRAQRRDHEVAVLVLDLDGLRDVHDGFGHAAGGRLLNVVTAVAGASREEDLLGRVDHQQVALLLEEVRHPTGPARVAERLLADLHPALEAAGVVSSVRPSIGIALSDSSVDGQVDAPVDGDLLLRRATLAVRDARQLGPGRYEMFEPGMTEKVRRRLRLESDLRAAVAGDAVDVHYLPEVDLRTGRLLGVEALVRWTHPTRGMLDPDQFIPVAEETGLIVPLGANVLHRAGARLRALHEELDVGVHMAVNVSAVQIDPRHGLVEDVVAMLEQTGVPPHRLRLEITESVLLTDASRRLEVLGRLRALGVELALDDFGTGFSSLAYLQQLPVNVLKLDRSFVENLHQPVTRAVVEAVVGLSLRLGMEVVAEGVTEPSQARQLAALGCAAAQGWLYGRPVSGDALAGWLLRQQDAAQAVARH